jgi:hypothetical protein
MLIYTFTKFTVHFLKYEIFAQCYSKILFSLCANFAAMRFLKFHLKNCIANHISCSFVRDEMSFFSPLSPTKSHQAPAHVLREVHMNGPRVGIHISERVHALSQRGHFQSQQRIIIILGEFFSIPCESDKIALSAHPAESNKPQTLDASCRWRDFLCVRRT